MLESQPVQVNLATPVHRRRIGVIYAIISLVLLALAVVQDYQPFLEFQLPAILLAALVVTTIFTGLLLVRARTSQSPSLALLLLSINATAALSLTAATGGYTSPLWVALLLSSTAAPLLLPGRWSILLLSVVWLTSGLFILQAPPDLRFDVFVAWGLRVAGVALVAIVLQRVLSAEADLRLRAQQRERVLHDFLLLSNKLRVTNEPQTILEEVSHAVQASGNFDCVTLSRVDNQSKETIVTVAFGSSGRRLKAVEELTIPWNDIAPALNEQHRVGPATFQVDTLPFRSIKHEQHLILPLKSQLADIQGMLTVSCDRANQDTLLEAVPLLELLANQAGAALENNALYGTLEQRVQDATETLTRNQEELALARDRAEMLYQIVRTLAGSLDEREVLVQALALVIQATTAECGGIMLVEPNTGRLAFRTTFDRTKAGPVLGLDRSQGLAGWVLANRTSVIIPDTQEDTRWHSQEESEERHRSALVVPLLLNEELMGVTILTHPEIDHFRHEHGQLALAASGQIAVALSKAQLYRYVSEQSDQLTVTLEQREEEISKIQAILRSIGDGVIVGDRLGRIRMINPAAAQMLNIPINEFVNRQMADLPGALLENSHIDGLEQLQVNNRTLRAHHAPVLSSTQEWLGSVVVYHDITREAMTDKLKSEFIATASHELRTPLTSIRGYIDLLLLGTLGPLSQSQIDFLTVVKNNVVRLVELIDDLLDVSRVEAGEVRLRRDLVDVSEVIYEVGEALYSQFTERSISLAIEVQEDLPKVIADRQRVRQIIVNLVNNACKYTEAGGHVDLILQNGGDSIRVDVRDNGVGISEEARNHVFTPFFRADNPLRETAGGTGLGLSITKTLVDLHGGSIWFESNEEDGTTFSFTLPLGNTDWTPAEWLTQTS
ncbi:MAG: ATP-binding protein [Chloroflexota bacterium]